jgi:chromosome segregation ATPase
MKIYSIKEIVKATNSFLKPETKTLPKKSKKIKNIKLPPEAENIIAEAESAILDENKKKPLILNNEVPNVPWNDIDSFNYKIKIKPEVKDHMINELYLYLKKKVRKSTLKLIIDEQLEIKNLRNKVNILKQNEANLKNSYQELKNEHESVLLDNKNLEINKVQLNSEINEFRISNEILQNDLNQVNENNNQLDKKIVELKNNNNVLHNNLNQVTENNKQFVIENKDLKSDFDKTKNDLNENIEKNRSNEIHNSELKNTVSRYIVNTKKIQEKLDLAEKSNYLKLEAQTEKVKFYQEENVRLSSELLAAQKKNTTIKDNLNFIETEKEEISNKIKELNKSIDEKTNIIPSNFIKQSLVKTEEKNETLNDNEQKSLDEVINRIFSKI